MKKQRPVYLDLLKIKQPAAALVSILHRLSGLLLFLFMPFFLLLLQQSLNSQASFDALKNYSGNPLLKTVAIFMLWGFAHHFFAGLRFLALDLHIGTGLAQSRQSAWWVMAAGILVAVSGGAAIW